MNYEQTPYNACESIFDQRVCLTKLYLLRDANIEEASGSRTLGQAHLGSLNHAHIEYVAHCNPNTSKKALAPTTVCSSSLGISAFPRNIGIRSKYYE